VPTFDTPADCTPWVIGGLWPVELATVTPETAAVADYLQNDLRRIADSANERIKGLWHAGLPEDVRRAEEARIINVARAFAVLRVESTVRQLRHGSTGFNAEHLSLTADPERPPPSAVEVEPAPAITPVPSAAETERLARLLHFVARQEPGLRWAVGERADGTTILVTDLAHGWIPSGIALPKGVELPLPGRRRGRASELLGEVVASVAYQPGDPIGSRANEPPPATSIEARRLPEVEALDSKLAEATRSREGLPRLAHTLAGTAAAGTGVLDAEVDVLRVHCETARYRLLGRYPDADAALLVNCLLLAATEALATGDAVSANYHFSWFEALAT